MFKFKFCLPFLTSILVLVNVNVFGQSWEFGGFLGGAGYMGDLNPVNPAKVNNLAFGGQIKRCFDPYWALKLAVTHGKIEAYDSDSKDAFQRDRNLSFFTPITEISLQTEFNFFNYVPSHSKKRWSPFLFAGLGLVAFNPKTIYDGQVKNLRLYGTEGQDPVDPYSEYAFTLPFGAGVKYNFAGKWSLIAEAGYRKTNTDYLDDVSGTYPLELPATSQFSEQDRRALSDRSLSGNKEPLSQRGDYRKRDTYMFVGFSLTYSIFKGGCPVVAN